MPLSPKRNAIQKLPTATNKENYNSTIRKQRLPDPQNPPYMLKPYIEENVKQVSVGSMSCETTTATNTTEKSAAD